MAEFHLKFHHSIQKLFQKKTPKWGDSSHKLINFKHLSGSNNLSGLNDLNSLFGLKKIKKLLAFYILSDFPGNRNLSSLNDLDSLNNLSGLNDLNSLFSSKNLGNLMFPSILAPKWPIWSLNVEWIIKNPLFYRFLALFLLEAVEAMYVTFNKIQGS